MSAVAPTRRVRRGRGHTYVLDGEPVPGVTTILSDGYPKPGLINWAADESAKYVLDHWPELVDMQPGDRYKAVLNARFDPLRRAGERGTDIHSYVHLLAQGEEVDPPEGFAPHVDAYLKFVDDWQPAELVAEAAVINRAHRYMGTLDTIADLRDGKRWLLDFKTSAKGVFLDHVLQLAAYRYAESYLTATGELEMPTVDRVGVVWLRADGYDLVPVKADEQTFRVFLYAAQVAQFTKAPYEEYIGDALSPPDGEA